MNPKLKQYLKHSLVFWSVYFIPVMHTLFIEPVHEGTDPSTYSDFDSAYMQLLILFLLVCWGSIAYRIATWVTKKKEP